MPLVQGAPRLKLLLLNMNYWNGAPWTAAMVKRLRLRRIQVIHTAEYNIKLPAIQQCLHEVFEESPKLLEYANLIIVG